MSALNLPQFKDPTKAREYLERVRWPTGPVCPHCGSISKDHYARQGEKRRPGQALKQMNKIVSLVERGGKVRSFHVADVTGPNLKGILYAQIHRESHVMTDSSPRYNLVKREKYFGAYDQVNHAQG